MKKYGVKELDLTKVPSKKMIKKLTSEVKKRYPNVYNVLIEERNKIMALNLKRLMESNPDKLIIAIIGAGHEEEMMDLIKKKEEQEITYSFEVK